MPPSHHAQRGNRERKAGSTLRRVRRCCRRDEVERLRCMVVFLLFIAGYHPIHHTLRKGCPHSRQQILEKAESLHAMGTCTVHDMRDFQPFYHS